MRSPLKKIFLPKAQKPSAAAEKFLNAHNVTFKRQGKGWLVVSGALYLNNKGLDELPDLTRVIVEGSFHCEENKLVSLKGAPRAVGGGFFCHNNLLTTLEGAPVEVPGGFNCEKNMLTSLKGAPKRVGGYFSCAQNLLATVEHGPAEVGETFCCLVNELESLHGAPKTFKKIMSDFGTYNNWQEVPPDVRLSDRERAEEGRAFETSATVLQEDLSVSKPIKFSMRQKRRR